MKTTLIYLRNWVLFGCLAILVSTISNGLFGLFVSFGFCFIFGVGYSLVTYRTSYNPFDPRIEE